MCRAWYLTFVQATLPPQRRAALLEVVATHFGLGVGEEVSPKMLQEGGIIDPRISSDEW